MQTSLLISVPHAARNLCVATPSRSCLWVICHQHPKMWPQLMSQEDGVPRSCPWLRPCPGHSPQQGASQACRWALDVAEAARLPADLCSVSVTEHLMKSRRSNEVGDDCPARGVAHSPSLAAGGPRAAPVSDHGVGTGRRPGPGRRTLPSSRPCMLL